MTTFLWVVLDIVWIVAIIGCAFVAVDTLADGDPFGLIPGVIAILLSAGLIVFADSKGVFDEPPCGEGTHAETRPTGYYTPVQVGKVTVMEPQYATKCYADTVPEAARAGQF